MPEFGLFQSEIDESSQPGEDGEQLVRRLAREKAFAGFEKFPQALVLGADTIVLRDGDVLGKPADPEEAKTMLASLSGRTHAVLTAVTLRWPQGMTAFTDRTEVTFRSLSESEIERYVAAGEPADKAGAYAIQGGARNFVTEIRGSESNVIGLPLEALAEALRAVR